MRSILTITILAALALIAAGCHNSGPPRNRYDSTVALPGNDFRLGVVTSSNGTLAAESDQTIQFDGPAVRFHVTTLGIDVAGVTGDWVSVGGNVYHLIVYKNGMTSGPNGRVSLQGDAGSVSWDTNVPIGSG